MVVRAVLVSERGILVLDSPTEPSISLVPRYYILIGYLFNMVNSIVFPPCSDLYVGPSLNKVNKTHPDF